MNTSICSGKDSFRVFLKAALVISALLFLIFFFNYFQNIEKFLSLTFDCLLFMRVDANVCYQIFTLRQFPHYYSYYFKGENVLFASPYHSVITPLTLLLPCVSLYSYYICKLCIHYGLALLGFVFLRKLFSLPYFSIMVMFIILGFNGRITSNIYAGHSPFTTYMWYPLLFFIYLSFMKRYRSAIVHSSVMATVLALNFFEGGARFVTWMFLFIILDAVILMIDSMIRQKGEAIKSISAPAKFWILSGIFYVGLSAVKLFPVSYIWERMNFVGGGVGYNNLVFFMQTFYQRGLGTTIPFKEFWLQEAYNYIGTVAFVLTIIAILYSLRINSDPPIRRLAIIAIVFLVFSVRTNYKFIFGSIPVFRDELAPTRFVFMFLAIISILIPLSIDKIMERLKFAPLLREMGMFFMGAVFFWQMFTESRKWMVIKGELIRPDIVLSAGQAPQGDYLFYFHAGLVVSIITLAGIILILMLTRRRAAWNTSSSQE